jgi:hypothetical protein
MPADCDQTEQPFVNFKACAPNTRASHRHYERNRPPEIPRLGETEQQTKSGEQANRRISVPCRVGIAPALGLSCCGKPVAFSRCRRRAFLCEKLSFLTQIGELLFELLPLWLAVRGHLDVFTLLLRLTVAHLRGGWHSKGDRKSDCVSAICAAIVLVVCYEKIWRGQPLRIVHRDACSPNNKGQVLLQKAVSKLAVKTRRARVSSVLECALDQLQQAAFAFVRLQTWQELRGVTVSRLFVRRMTLFGSKHRSASNGILHRLDCTVHRCAS